MQLTSGERLKAGVLSRDDGSRPSSAPHRRRLSAGRARLKRRSWASDERRVPESALASIVIVAYGQRAVTARCLELLADALGPELVRSFELVLVDNDSPDDTAEL